MAPTESSRDPVVEATEYYRAGRKSQAERICRQVLDQSPQNDAAWQLLGIMALDAKREDLAVRMFMRALDIAPQKPGYYVNLAVGLHKLGKTREAVEALKLAISLQPELAEAHFNLGRCLTDLGEEDSAFAAVERAARLQPNSFEIQRHYARMSRLRGESQKAVDPYWRALGVEPNSLECLIELAAVMRGLRRTDEALALARRAVAAGPTSAAAHNELGQALLLNEQPDAAVEVLTRASSLDPTLTDVWLSLGNACEAIGQLGQSIEYFRRALSMDPTLHQVHSNIIYLLQFMPGVTPACLLEEARAWDRAHARPFDSSPVTHGNDRDPERRLRVGYVSSHFYNHCQTLFTAPLFEHHDRARFEIVAYSCVEHPDAATEKLRQSAAVWRDVSRLDAAALADMIRDDAVDILVDLAMHMGDGRLKVFADKPAPVQISWLAYPGTTGLSAIDYRITDLFLDPPILGPGPYSERSIVLPDTFWCYDPLVDGLDGGQLPALSNGVVTFGCLNHFRKINDPLLELWAQVLANVQDSRLLLLAPPGQAQARIVDLLGRRGIEARRVAFVQRCSRTEYLRNYQRIDICLDTHPYSGHTTSMDAFWMGVPVVSLVGSTVVGRAAISIAGNLGLDRLVATTQEEFVATATALANDLDQLRELRQGLRAKMCASPLMQGRRFARALEAAYRLTWRNWCVGTPPESTPMIVAGPAEDPR